jgi:hypothetical protein
MWYWRVNVVRTTPNSFAYFLHEKVSSGYLESFAAAMTVFILTEVRYIKGGVLHGDAFC